MYLSVKSYEIIHPLGFSAEEVFDSIAEKKSGLRLIEKSRLDKPVFAACFSDEQNDRLNRLCPFDDCSKFERLLLLAGKNALEKAGINHKDRVLTIVATTKGGIEDIESATNTPIWLSAAKTMNRLLPGTPMTVVSNACISGLSAIIAGKRLMNAGNFDYLLVVGADTVSDFVLSGFNALMALSDKPCRPFDRSRNGINLGEGAAAIVFRRRDSGGERENETIVSGGAITNDANHVSAPSRTGAELADAIAAAMRESGAESVDFVSAHGTGTIYNDEMESRAFEAAGLSAVPLHGLKPYLGHTLGAAGVIESVICIKSLEEGIMIPTQGYAEQGTSCRLNVLTTPKTGKINRILKTMSGFGGCNAAVCFEKI